MPTKAKLDLIDLIERRKELVRQSNALDLRIRAIDELIAERAPNPNSRKATEVSGWAVVANVEDWDVTLKLRQRDHRGEFVVDFPLSEARLLSERIAEVADLQINSAQRVEARRQAEDQDNARHA